MLRIVRVLIVIAAAALVLSACNFPTPEANPAEQTMMAETVAAAVDQATPVSGDPGESASTPTATTEGQPAETLGTDTSATPGPTATDEIETGDDQAEFIADVTIPDYSEIETGEEFTKTWRIRNTGTTTWSAEYVLEFEKGQKMGAPTQVPLGKEVKPNQMVDISVEFTAPDTAGEYTSYWILKNEDNQRVGVADEDKYLSLFTIIEAVKPGSGDGGSSGGASISGGAKVTGASVTVSPKNYSGSCPGEVNFNYTVTTSNAGKVQFNLVFNVISPNGYKFDPAPQYEVSFTSGYTVNYSYTLFSSNSVTATVRVRAVGSNEYLSPPVEFTVNCN